ncbi:MAG: hypothetical protein U1A16_01590 [Patescibacteria group bacterium]|nr:hypothetical protein [Patescibacteria group bacterium]
MFTKSLVIAAFTGILTGPATMPVEPSAAPVPVTLSVVHETTLTAARTPETPTFSTLPSPRTFVVKPQRRWVVATAYSSTPDQTDDTPFITASGTTVRDGIVAANWLPIGAQIRLPEVYGDKVFVVEDRMHPRFGDRLDIWMTTREEAKQFGIRRVLVEVF